MGAEQSSNRPQGQQATAAAAPRKTCYYETLGVERQAADEEIRRAYRRKALELHPDRNLGDVENATRRFAEVQTAYEILSDPQERAWYDSHREAILHDDPDGTGAGPTEFHNVRLTTADELYTLIGRFNSSVPFTDSPTGFFGILDETFAHLAEEEAAAWEWGDGSDAPVEYSPFGSAVDPFDTVARPFYAVWSGFSTIKSFSWHDKYRLSDAPDRRVRRLMEKENRKIRDEAAREFNDAVRSLIAFVKKRDPRYVPNKQSEAERQKALRDSAAAQAARSRAANQARTADDAAAEALADWAKAREGESRDDGAEEFAWSEEEASEVEHIECVVCNKTFKSERQYETHERSKKHIRAVQQLRREMERENVVLDLDLNEQDSAEKEPSSDDSDREGDSHTSKDPTHETLQEHDGLASVVDEAGVPLETTTDGQGLGPSSPSAEETDEDDDYAPRDAVQNRLFSDSPSLAVPSGDQKETPVDALADGVEDVSIQEKDASSALGRKIGKAKAKRERKAAKQAATAAQADEVKCGVCSESFASRTKLFAHIREEGHAELKPAGKGGKKQKQKR